MHTEHTNPAVYKERGVGLAAGDASAIMEMQSLIDSLQGWVKHDIGSQVSDRQLHAGTQKQSLSSDASLCFGRIVLSYPYTHTYRVQLAGNNGTCIASALARNSHSPVGVRAGDVLPPNSDVIVWRPNSSSMAYILGVVPSVVPDDRLNLSDVVQAGGNSSVKKIEAFRTIVNAERNAFSWMSQSCGRPIDGTLNEYVRMSETGIGLLIDSFQTYLRVNEACGLFLNYFDSYTKLSGLNLDVTSYASHDMQRNDEGEIVSVRGYATYPWESLGLYAPGHSFTQVNDPTTVQLDRQSPVADVDLQEGDQTPVHRVVEYAGYLGQGKLRTLMKPAADSGKRLMRDADAPDTGLFHESLTLDGGYSVRSSKYIMFSKYPSNPVPRRRKSVEDGQGDDSSGDYKFSGQFGTGEDHVVEEWRTEEDFIPNMLRPAAILDTLARHHNWKATHAFHYHRKDYVLPDESGNGELNSVSFLRGRFDESYREVYPKKLRIDTKYRDVDYYATASVFSMTEDGSIVLTDGYGSRIVMGGGQIRLEASADCLITAGGRVVTLGKEVVMRAKDHVDVSASDGELRLKAEKNLQILAGNSGSGSLLLESRGRGEIQEYANRIGDEVQASGITLLAKGSNVSMASQSAYFRTGVSAESAESFGDLVLDVGNGRSDLKVYASSHLNFLQDAFGIWYMPVGQMDPQMEATTYFSRQYSQLNGPMTVRGSMTLTDNGSLGVAQDVFANGNVIAVRYVAAAGGWRGIADSSQNGIPEAIQQYVRAFEDFGDRFEESGEPVFVSTFPERWWGSSMPGNADLLANRIGFSYRDTSRRGTAYGYTETGFFLLESWWQMLGRRGLVHQGEVWEEKPVTYQGDSLYPWPGKVNWVDESRLVSYSATEGTVLFDGTAAVGRQAQQAEYEKPTYGAWAKTTCDGNYRL